MFLSANRIEKNKAAGLGVAGRRMRPAMTSFERHTPSGVRIGARPESAFEPPERMRSSAGERSPAAENTRKNAA